MVYGKTVYSGGVSGGDVGTGLSRVEFFHIITAGGTQKALSMNETLTLESGDVTVVTESANTTIYWIALGIE